ncbi:recombinase family protein [Prescottella equi]|uniref:recombinase family protein n=1 Tax=Rhodococcus hoagii TaxID=43767 RepID=UPI000A108A8D|nr:recombinase family protein [Prescottella equi]NKR41618.1 recombinase family protein [Prescottella equi]NKR68992.1 recombinase family protein [Prescottella equi]
MTTPRSAAIYARISSDPDQRRSRYGKAIGGLPEAGRRSRLIVGDEYIDNDVSASKSRRRPEYERMPEGLEAGDRDAVVVHNMDRLILQPM